MARDTTRSTARDPAYEELDLLERFLLQVRAPDGTWFDEAICTADSFDRNPDGSYICSAFSSGLWLRCVAGDADGFEHVDGGGDRFHYRLIALPSVS